MDGHRAARARRGGDQLHHRRPAADVRRRLHLLPLLGARLVQPRPAGDDGALHVRVLPHAAVEAEQRAPPLDQRALERGGRRLLRPSERGHVVAHPARATQEDCALRRAQLAVHAAQPAVPPHLALVRVVQRPGVRPLPDAAHVPRWDWLRHPIGLPAGQGRVAGEVG
eukprot:7391642-Prymnesium_polylepis.2